MAVDNSALKLIFKACCRSVVYDADRRQFALLLVPGLQAVWTDLKPRLRQLVPTFSLDDFNRALEVVKNPAKEVDLVSVDGIADSDLVNGEVLSITFSDGRPLTLVRMKAGQYLDAATGNGLSFGSGVELACRRNLTTSEGRCLGTVGEIALLSPSAAVNALSQLVTPRYFARRIEGSLWPLFEEARAACLDDDGPAARRLADAAAELGVGLTAMFHIINAAAKSCH